MFAGWFYRWANTYYRFSPSATPVHAVHSEAMANAARAGDVGRVRRLLAAGVPADAVDGHGVSALMWAIMRGRDRTMRVLLQAGADPNRPFRDRVTAVAAAVGTGSVRALEILASAHRLDVAGRLEQLGGETLVYMATRQGDGAVPMVRLLLKLGADPNVPGCADQLPLWIAARSGSLRLIEVLLAGGARLNGVDPLGQTALMAASDAGRLEAARLLLRHGADVSARDALGGATALHRAAYRSSGVVKMLLARGADPNQGDHIGQTPLMNAAVLGRLSTAGLLLRAGADPNAATRFGDTALSIAVRRRHPRTAALLRRAAGMGRDRPSAARADRDIVFAGWFYRWANTYYRFSPGAKPERQLQLRAHGHLYRINPDGTGLRQITHSDCDDVMPVWSPDGRQILFARRVGQRAVLCVVDENGQHLRRLLEVSDDYIWCGEHAWSPDGKWIAATWPRYASRRYDVLVVNARTGVARAYHGWTGFAWAPDSARLLLMNDEGDHASIVRVDGGSEVRVPVGLATGLWLDSDTIAAAPAVASGGGARNDALSIVSADGQTVRRIALHTQSRNGTVYPGGVPVTCRWSRIPAPTEQVVGWARYSVISGGAEYACWAISISTGEQRSIIDGQLVGVSPDGKRIAAATSELVGPYKHGGTWCGPLEIVDIATGKRKAITSRLVSIAGGDWRKAK